MSDKPTFNGREISFGNEWQAINHAFLAEALGYLTQSERGEWYQEYLLDWIYNYLCDYGDQLKWVVGSAGAHARLELREAREERLKQWRMIKALYPLGYDNRHRISIITRRNMEAAIMAARLREVKLWTMQKDYKTITGHLRSRPDMPLVWTETDWWQPSHTHPELEEAREYMAECRRLQAGPQGRKAKRLLLDNLEDYQVRDYFEKGYFFVRPKEPGMPLEKRKLYIIERSFPNGNIVSVFQGQSKDGQTMYYPEDSFCYHSADPHPMDDILLAQKFMIEEQHDEFLKEANRYEGGRHGREPLLLNARAI